MSPEKARILIVEDDALIAMELEARMSAHGCAVVGPSPTIAVANGLLDQVRPHAALLDVNVCNECIAPIADLGVPYVLVTGRARLTFAESELQVAKLFRPVAEAELTRTEPSDACCTPRRPGSGRNPSRLGVSVNP